MSKKVICLFTQSYPFGSGETFLETELPIIAEYFEKVYIFPLFKEKMERRVPENVGVGWIDMSGYSTSKGLLNTSIKNWSVLWKEMNVNGVSYDGAKKKMSEFLRYNYRVNKLYEFLEKNKLDLHNSVFYTYWMNEWAIALSFLKLNKSINGYVFSRAHGFDLYSERRSDGKIPFQWFCVQQFDRVSLISNQGHEYISHKFAQHAHKFTLDYLGVKDNGLGQLPNSSESFVVLSCSNLFKVKRVHLIAEALETIKNDIYWLHFGDGPEKEKVEQVIKRLPGNIRVEMKGRVPNTEVLDYMKNNPVNVFVNVSSSEGLPVSIMEAISFGIPVIATDVGGTREIVNEETGVLLEEDFRVEDLREQIEKFVRNGMDTEMARQKIRSFWKAHFSSEINYHAFAQSLENSNECMRKDAIEEG